MSENSVNLAEDALLRVKQLEVKFVHFEADARMNDSCLIEFDDELEQGRINLEKLEKRVTELESENPELFEERLASLKTENAELRDHLNVTVDTLNKVVKIINDQVIPRFEPADGPNPDVDDGVDYHHYLAEVNELTQDERNGLLSI